MKMKKAFGALAVLLALTVVACGGGNNSQSAAPSGSKSASSAPSSSSSSAQPKITVTAADSKTEVEVGQTLQLSSDVAGVTWESSAVAVATVNGEGLVTGVATGEATITAKKDGYKNGTLTIKVPDPSLKPLVRNYTEGTPAKNSAEKEYIPLADPTANKVGVKIAIANWVVADFEGATATAKLASDGGIEPKNDHNAFIAFKIKAPRAGNYQMVVSGKGSSSGEGKTLDDRAFAVKLNGEAVDVKGDREPINSTDYTAFVAAPTMALRGPEQEDVIALSCSDYRIKFDTASFVLFNEI